MSDASNWPGGGSVPDGPERPWEEPDVDGPPTDAEGRPERAEPGFGNPFSAPESPPARRGPRPFGDQPVDPAPPEQPRPVTPPAAAPPPQGPQASPPYGQPPRPPQGQPGAPAYGPDGPGRAQQGPPRQQHQTPPGSQGQQGPPPPQGPPPGGAGGFGQGFTTPGPEFGPGGPPRPQQPLAPPPGQPGQPYAGPNPYGPPPSGPPGGPPPGPYGPPGQANGKARTDAPQGQPGEAFDGSERSPAYAPWDRPADEAQAPWGGGGEDAPPLSPEARRGGEGAGAGSGWEPHGGDLSFGFSDDELDLDDKGRKKLPLLIGGVVVVIALVVAAVFAWPMIKPGSSNAGREKPAAQQPTGPAKVVAGPVEKALKSTPGYGFACYDTLQNPVKVRSCYATVQNSVPMVVRLQLGKGEEISAAQLYAGLGGLERGPALKAFDRVSKTLGEQVLGKKDAGKLPTAKDGHKQNAGDLVWGSGAVNVSTNSAVTELIRSKAEVNRHKQVPLRPGPKALQTTLTTKGFTCKPGVCERFFGKGKAKYSLGVAFGPTTVRVAFRQAADKRKLDEEAVNKGFSDVIGLVTNAPNREAVLNWVEDNHDTQYRKADFEDVHAQLLWGDGTKPELTLSSPIAWN